MDPDDNLAEQAERPINKDRLLELRIALTDWLAQGGFEPDWSKHESTSKAFRSWCIDRGHTYRTRLK